MSCLISIEQKLCKAKYFNCNLCPMQWHLLIKGLLSRILESRVWPWYSTSAIHKLQSCKEMIRSRLRDVTSSSLAKWVQFPQGAEPLFLCHFAWHLAHQCTYMRAFILLQSLYFLLLRFRQRKSRADRVLTLNMNILLLLFWSIWSWAIGQDWATCAGLAH